MDPRPVLAGIALATITGTALFLLGAKWGAAQVPAPVCDPIVATHQACTAWWFDADVKKSRRKICGK